MKVSEIICEQLDKLPSTMQNEVMEFVRFLLWKMDQAPSDTTEGWMSEFSLTSAMPGMDDVRERLAY